MGEIVLKNNFFELYNSNDEVKNLLDIYMKSAYYKFVNSKPTSKYEKKMACVYNELFNNEEEQCRFDVFSREDFSTVSDSEESSYKFFIRHGYFASVCGENTGTLAKKYAYEKGNEILNDFVLNEMSNFHSSKLDRKYSYLLFKVLNGDSKKLCAFASLIGSTITFVNRLTTIYCNEIGDLDTINKYDMLGEHLIESVTNNKINMLFDDNVSKEEKCNLLEKTYSNSRFQKDLKIWIVDNNKQKDYFKYEKKLSNMVDKYKEIIDNKKLEELVHGFLSFDGNLEAYCEKINMNKKSFVAKVNSYKESNVELYNEFKKENKKRNKRLDENVEEQVLALIDYLNTGVMLEDGTTRKFDIIDFKMKFDLDYYAIHKFVYSDRSNIDIKTSHNVLAFMRNSAIRFIEIEIGLKSKLDEKYIYIDKNGEEKILSDDEKIDIINYLDKIGVEKTDSTYYAAINRYRNGNLYINEKTNNKVKSKLDDLK